MMGYTDEDVEKMISGVTMGLLYLQDTPQGKPFTISMLEMTKDFLEGLLEEGRM